MSSHSLALAIEVELGVSSEDAQALAASAEPLWEVLERLGWTDRYGGMECHRVLPAALSFIHREANQGPFDASLN